MMLFKSGKLKRRRKSGGCSGMAGVAEFCEARSLLSAVTPTLSVSEGAQRQIPVLPGAETNSDGSLAAQLQSWRDQVRDRLVSQADEWWGETFGQTETRPAWYWFGGGPGIDVIHFDGPALAGLAENALSRTNTQVEGVDEGDIVETDGEYLYILSGQQLSILRAGGADGTELVSQVNLSDRPVAMFLNGDTLTVVSESQQFLWRDQWSPGRMMAMPVQMQPPTVTVSVIDISDRTAPVVERETLIDGSVLDTRAIGGDVLVVVRNDGGGVSAPSLNWTVTETQERTDEDGNTWTEETIVYETRDEYLSRLDKMIQGLYPPGVYQQTATGDGVTETLEWLDGDSAIISAGDYGQSMISVVRIDTTGDGTTAPDTVSVAAGFGGVVVYATETSLYLARTETVWEIMDFVAIVDPPSDDGTETGDEVPQEVLRSYDVTTLTRIDLTRDDLTVAASGMIEGSVRDQFSIDEYNGYLRVATSRFEDGTISSGISVLQEIDGVLYTVGQVAGLAPGEQLFAVRFAAERAWIVTFEQVDPLFTIDLSDPTSPVVAGQLTIPGYSEYLQPIDADHVLAIGRNVDPETGMVQELQISLFDVSDAASPQLRHQYSFDVSGYQWSEASYDHHAFSWLAEHGALVIPLSSSSVVTAEDGSETWTSTESLAILSVDPSDGISLLGTVEQSGDVVRGVQVGDNLYSISSESVVVVAMDQPDVVLAEVSLVTPPDEGAVPVLQISAESSLIDGRSEYLAALESDVNTEGESGDEESDSDGVEGVSEDQLTTEVVELLPVRTHVPEILWQTTAIGNSPVLGSSESVVSPPVEVEPESPAAADPLTFIATSAPESLLGGVSEQTDASTVRPETNPVKSAAARARADRHLSRGLKSVTGSALKQRSARSAGESRLSPLVSSLSDAGSQESSRTDDRTDERDVDRGTSSDESENMSGRSSRGTARRRASRQRVSDSDSGTAATEARVSALAHRRMSTGKSESKIDEVMIQMAATGIVD